MTRDRHGSDRFGMHSLSIAWIVVTLGVANPAQSEKTIQLDEVARGRARVVHGDARTTIRVSNNAILNYRRFDVPDGYRVRFVQPNAASRVLNRVTSNDPSRIDGSIRANGKVYLVNPAGVIFGNNAVIDASQFFVSAGMITDNDFILGRDRFTADRGTVVNHGTLIADNGVHLFGYQVKNTGTILARKGLVTMTAGEQVMISEGDSSIYVRVDGLDAFSGHADNAAQAVTGALGVSNSGTVRADDVVISAGDVHSLALSNTGNIRAVGGSITMAGNGLVTNEGKLNASDARDGRTGGNVSMFGEHVGVLNGFIDASGDAGGGTVLIGGDYMGKGPHRNASGTYIGEQADIFASALTHGDGGHVIVWADEVTRVYGDIAARGGAAGGDGGFVETSGKHYLDVTRAADVSAPMGAGGMWLLDPSNVTIQNAAGTIDGFTPLFVATADDSTVSAGVILTALDAGTSVTISTARLLGAQDGDITVNADVTLNKTAGGNATLTLLAANDININGPISSSSGQLNVVLTANDVLQVVHDLDAAAGDINVDAAITTNGGSFITTGRDFSNTADIVTGGGLVSLIHTGDITLDAAITTSNGAVTATATGGGSTLTINDAISAGSGIVSLDALGTVELGAASSITTTSGAVNIGAVLAGTINLGGTLTTTGGNVTFDRPLTLANDYTIDTSGGNGNVTLTDVVDGASLLTIDAGLGIVDLQAGIGTTTALAEVDITAATITVDGDVLTTGDQTYTGDITLAAVTIDSATAGAILFDGDVTLTGDVIASTAGALTDDITVTGDIDGGSILTLDAGAAGLIDLQADVGSSVALAEIDLTAAGISIDADILTTGDQTYTGDLTLANVLLDSATAGSIVCDGTITLLADVVISTAGALTDDITITGDVDGPSILTLNAGAAGLIDLQAGIGTSTALAEVDLTAAGISVDGDVLTTGDQTYTGDITLAAVTIDSATAGALLFDGDITLTGDVIASTAGALTDDITITGDIDGASILTINAGAAGLIDLQADLGSSVALAEVDLTAAGISIDADILTTGDQTYTGDLSLANVLLDSATAGSIICDGTVTLLADAVISTAGALTDDITITGAIDGASILTLNAGAAGLIDLQADIGTSTALTEVDLTAAGITVDGDVLTTGDQTYTGDITLAAVTIDSATAGAILLDGDVTLTGDVFASTAGALTDDITITGDVDGASILTLNAGAAGLIDLQADIGSSSALAEVDLTAAGIAVDGDVLTTGDQTYTGDITLAAVTIDSATAGAILFDGDITLTGDTDISTAGAATDDVTITGDIDGASILTINAGAAGLIDLQADLGSSVALAEVDLTAAGISIDADILTTGDQTYTGDLSLANVLLDSATAGSIICDGTVTLLADAVISTAGALTDDITITGDVDGASILTLNAGAAGLIDLQADIGSSTALAEVDLTAAGITVDGDVLTTGDQTYTGDITLAAVTIDSATVGAILFDGNVTLTGDVIASTAGALTDDITITGDIDGASILTLDAGAAGLIDLQADIGSSTRLAGIDLTAAALTIDIDILTTGDQDYTGDVDLGGDLDSAGGDITITGDLIIPESLTPTITTGAGEGDFTVTGRTLGTTGGAIETLTVDTGTGNTTFVGLVSGDGTNDDAIGLTTLTITNAEDVSTAIVDLTGDLTTTNTLTGTWSSTGLVTSALLTLDAQDISLTGGFASKSNVSLTAVTTLVISGANSTADGAIDLTGPASLAVDLTSTAAGDISINDTLTLAGDVTLTSFGGAGDDITLGGAVNGGQNLDLDAGAGGLVDLQDDVGAATALTSIDITAAGISVDGDVLTTGDQTYTGDTTLANVTLDSATAGAILLDGDVTLTGDTDITTAGGAADDVTITGDIDGAVALLINAGSGDVTLQADLGGTTPLDSLDATGALVDVQGEINLTDDLTLAGDEIDFGGGDDSVTVGGIVTLAPTAAGVSIDVGSPVGGTGTLDLSDTDMDAIANGSTEIIIGRTDGTHTITVGTLAVVDPLTLQSPLGGSIDVTGDITATGDASLSLDSPTINLDADLTTAGDLVDVDGAVTLGADVSIDTTNGGGVAAGADITIGSTVDGGQDLTLNAGTAGDIQIDDDMGGTTPLDDVTITNANDVTITGDIDAGSLTQSAGGGDTTITGDITTSGAVDTAGGDVQVSIAGDITINGDIDTTGGAAGGGNPGTDGGDVDLTTTGGGVVVAGIDTSGSDAAGGSNGDGGDAGDITIQPDSGLTLGGAGAGDQRPDGTVTLGGTVTATGGSGDGAGSGGDGGDVSISATGRTGVPSVATVQGATTGGDIVINATGDITFGQNEKVSARGDIDLTSDNNTITVGDLSATGDLTLDAGEGGTITINRRDAGSVLRPGATLIADDNVDWVGHTGSRSPARSR